MFSTLRPSNTVYILEQSDRLILKIGTITSMIPNYTGSIDMKVKTQDQEYEFQKIPYSQTIAKNGSLTISETMEGILNEVAKIKENASSILNNREFYLNQIKDCDEILRTNNPKYDKELKRDEEIDNLKQQVSEIASSLTSIEKLLVERKEK